MITPAKILSPTSFRSKRRLILVCAFLAFIASEVVLGSGIFVTYPFLLGALVLPLIPLAFLGFLLNQEIGATILIFCMFFVPLAIPSGTETLIPVSLVFVFVWILVWLVKMALLDHQIRLAVNKTNLPILIFTIITILAFFWSRFLIDPQLVVPGKFIVVQVGTIGVTAASLLTTLLCANVVRRVSIVKNCFFLVILGSFIYLPIYFFDNIHLGGIIGRLTGPAGLASDWFGVRGLFPMWICVLSLAYLLYAKNEKKWPRLVVAAAFGLWMFRLVAISLYRFSSWLPTLVALMVLLFIYSRKWFFIVCAIGAIIVIFNYNLFYNTIIAEKADEGTLAGEYSRQNLIVQALDLGKDHLLLGTGPAGYRNYYITYDPDVVLSTHNNYLDMFLQYGVTGLLIFIWLLFALLRELKEAIRWQEKGSFEQAFTIGCLAGSFGMLVGMALGDWVIPFAYNQTIYGFSYTAYNWLFPGLALALGYIGRQKHLAKINNESVLQSI